MKKLLIIIFISVLGKLFAMEIHVENLNLKKNKLEFSIRIELNNDSKVCCTNLDNPCYKVINNKLYITSIIFVLLSILAGFGIYYFRKEKYRGVIYSCGG